MHIPREAALEILKKMVLIRRFEERVQGLFRKAEMPGFIHMSIGQESVPAAACAALRANDTITSTHRGHGHCIAKGVDIDGMVAELYAKATGTCGGRSGSMHIADMKLGIFGANGIVGANIGIAAGAAFAAQVQGRSDVSLAFAGDGAINTGMFHEVMNLAAIWKLPLIVLVENNGWTEMRRSQDFSPVARVADRAASYGLPRIAISDDPEEVYASVSVACEAARTGGGPALIDAATYRWFGHYEGDSQDYCSREEIAEIRAHDSLRGFKERCFAAGFLTEREYSHIEEQVSAKIDMAVERARGAPEPAEDQAWRLDLAYA